MVEEKETRKRHFILEHLAKSESFKKPQSPIPKSAPPERDRQRHGWSLLQQVRGLESDMATARQAQTASGMEGGFGLSIEFESFPDVEMAFASLARDRSRIELLNVRRENGKTFATVFVPDGKLSHFEKLILAYIEEKCDKAGKPRDNRNLVDSIQAIRTATLKALWTDDLSVFPSTDEDFFWWEVWLPVGENREATLSTFRRLAQAQGFKLARGELLFPERTVLMAFGSAGMMKRSMMTLNSIAELRKAKDTAEFFDSLKPVEQAQWVDELLSRATFARPEELVPYVCLLDTGVNRGHPLISPALTPEDLHSIEPAWGTDDDDGHGTNMAGLALIGNLAEALESGEPVMIGHRLESVKLLPKDGDNPGDSHLHGYLTVEAVSRPEVTAPRRPRAFGMAVTAADYRDRGEPSAWSAALDRLAADSDGSGETPRLLLVAAGNIKDIGAWADYPKSNSLEGIHDPGQAWNALTIGAFTDLQTITEPSADKYRPIAPPGGLSPFSTTSNTWKPEWPMKPDVVFEGGNAARDILGPCWMPSLSLLTTHHNTSERLFTTANATSAATALASQMAARLMAAYPKLWPESIRALIVHSARWTPAMEQMFLKNSTKRKKSDVEQLIRHCGYGVPNLDRALWSVSNSLTMVIQEQLHPFQREGTDQPKFRDMHLYELPWPLEELEQLGDIQVEMRVTLSYFIEPNPSKRGFRSRYSYESHGLRFDVKRAAESLDDFRARINAAARDEEEGTRNTGGYGGEWTVGKQRRHKGSLHSDIWKGSAADLASRGVLAVYPAAGWWKDRTRLQRYNKMARYTLVVSIHAPEVEADLYTEVANQITTQVMVEV